MSLVARGLFRALPLLVMIGCGARTTIDQSDYDEAGWGASGGVAGTGANGSGATGSGATGSGATGSGATSTGGVSNGGASTGGSISTGGSVSVGGGTTAGSGGVAGGDGMPGPLKEACQNFCAPYVAVCPGEYTSAEQCALECRANLVDSSKPCKRASADALDCLGASIVTSLSCDQAILAAYNACADLIAATDKCDDGSQPPPDPGPGCSGTESSSPEICSLTVTCGSQTYSTNCYYVSDQSSYCECKGPSSGSGFEADISLDQACTYAAQYCGFPY